MIPRPWVTAAVLSIAFSTIGCSKNPERAEPSASAAAVEGLCEHGVEADLCPKCNPTLEAVYRGNGDWCPEHGMPESFCPICHPALGGHPPASGGEKKPSRAPSKAPANGMKVRLASSAVEEGSGIVTVEAVKAPAKTAVRFPARVVYDATRSAEISANAGGVVRSIKVDLGARVRAGDTLATLDSAAVGGDRAKLAAAYGRIEAARERVDRLKELEKAGVVSRRDRVDAELELAEAQSAASTLSASLGVSGASAGSGASYTLKSPIDGIVTRRSATVGKLALENETLFEIVDPSVLWAELDIPEPSAGAVAEGAEVTLTFPSLPSEAFAGTVSALLPEVDPHTRTVTARVSVKNPALHLRANMLGEAAVLGKTPPEGVTVPRSAIQTVDRQLFVFVRVEPLVFEVRHVVVTSKDGDAAVVTSGLVAGDAVVTTGSFLLKTETLKDSIGAGCCAND